MQRAALGSRLKMMTARSETLPLEYLSDVGDRLAQFREAVETRLDALVPASTVAPQDIHAAIRWSLFAGGKRFRPLLLLATGEEFGAERNRLLDAACALELIHSYSLIHDDLPSMDDDDLRRGRPTCHLRFGEANAILAGDALQTLAFQTLAEDENLSAGIRVRVIAELARASATPEGMVAGQALDLAAESRDVPGDELEQIHRLKTGSLIVASVRAGAIIAEVSETDLDTVTRYGFALGLLFQITDDLLDVTATAEDLGKTPGKDARARKATYPSLYGMEATRGRALTAYNEALAALDEIGRPMPLLRAIAQIILERRA